MKKIEDSQSRKRVLVGFAVDVSGSMQQSIGNQSGKNENRFDRFRESLKELSQEAKKEIESNRQKGSDASIDVFAYAFGLKDIEYCDLLTLFKFGQEFSSDIKEKENTFQRKFSNPYEELEDIAKKSGIDDIPGFRGWIEKAVPRTEEAERLAERLNSHSRIAAHIVKLLPKDFQDAITAVKSYKIRQTPFINKFASVLDREDRSRNLRKAESLARELANASDDEIRKIIVREIGSGLEKELREHGETTMPLEQVADLLESKESQLENLEPLIYGKTPMKSALGAIIKRFKKELDRLPEDTVSVLFILSDGMPTDGDPMPVANTLKYEGVYIISCFVTDRNITDPRCLFDTSVPQWNDGAKLMFNMASSIDKDSVFTRYLLELGWKMPSKPKLFVQVNHSEVLDEFTRVVLGPIMLD